MSERQPIPTAVRVPTGPDETGPFAQLRGELTAQIYEAMPGLLVADPADVKAAVDVVADVLGDVLGLARIGLPPATCQKLAIDALIRADHVAAARWDGTSTGCGA